MIELFPTHIQRLILTNHKCFYEPTEFEFGPGFNILVGENSSGKSTVLEALDPASSPYPHRSLLSETSQGFPKNEPHSIISSYRTSAQAISNFTGQSTAYIGTDGDGGNELVIPITQWAKKISTESLNFDVKRSNTNGVQIRLCLNSFPSVWQLLSQRVGIKSASYELKSRTVLGVTNFGDQCAQWSVIHGVLAKRTYRFLTERRILESAGHSDPELLPDGSNLAYCLTHLATGIDDTYQRFNRMVQRIFPTIRSVSARPDSGQFLIRINHLDQNRARDDLTVHLSQVGTGVGNVLAMLYVSLTAKQPRTILLEEPNSYLHPRALRELLAILSDNDVKHQYFISTHSSDVLRSVKATSVTYLKNDGQQSTSVQVSGADVGELKAGLLDMGIRLSDLHGCDHVLWVEGQTEEAVFPLLIRKYFGVTASTVAVLRVHATSDFEGEVKDHHLDPIKVAKIYKKLSTGNALAPHMSGIVLDRDGRPKTQCEKIEKESMGLIHFLARPMLEDYLLRPAAIAELIRERTGIVVSADEVTAKLETAKLIADCWIEPKAKTSELHAAKALKYVCHELTDGKLEYSKTRDGPALVEHLLRFEPDGLIQLKELLRTVLFGKQSG